MNSNNSINGIFILLLIVAILIALIFIKKKLKTIKIGAVTLITGAVKSRKSCLSFTLARREYKKNVRMWYIRKFLCFILRRPIPLKPMFYTNMPVRNIRFNKFTINILLRKVRIPEKSVVLLDEASLIADSMLYKNDDINFNLMMFVKLFGHYSHGGKLFINTQSISDLHFAFKRCINNYLFIHSATTYPFITVCKVREMIYSDDKSSINVFNEDIEESLKRIVFFNKVYKQYDQYYLSAFTDDLEYEVDYDEEILIRGDSLKSKHIVSLNEFINSMGVVHHESD